MIEHGNYASKTVAIVAFHWEGQPPQEWPEWARNDLRLRYEITNIQVDTPNGAVRANQGDWIILGTENEVYPCPDSVFNYKYEKCSDAG